MSCTIWYRNKYCKILLPFTGTQKDFNTFITKRLGLRENDRYSIISDNEYDPSSENQINIKSPNDFVSNHQYKLIYINQEVKKVQHVSRARKLNKMRRAQSGFEGLPFSRQTKAFKSRTSWKDLLRRSSKLAVALKAESLNVNMT